jgi:hypothetical protein
VYGARTDPDRRACDNAAMPGGTFVRTRAVAAVALGLSLSLAACNSESGSSAADGDPSPLDAVAKATGDAAGTARGTMDLALGHGTFTSRWDGTFTTGRGTSSGQLPGPGNPALDARWTGGNVYVRHTTDPDVYGLSPLGQVMSDKPPAGVWGTLPVASMAARVVTPLSPPDLVAALAVNGNESERPGPRIGGVDTRRITVTGHHGLILNWTGPKRAEVLVDDAGRARRITVTAANESLRVDVRYSDEKLTVQKPSAADLAPKPVESAAPIGPYLTVRTGSDGGVAWTVQKAPGRNGTECWRWTSTPPLEVVKPNYLTDTRCQPPMPASGPETDAADQVEILLWTDGSKAASEAVVARFPDTVNEVTLGFVGGRTQTVPVSGGLLTWIGPSTEPLGYLGLTNGGAAVSCGVAAVSGPGDLGNDTLVGDPFHSAWSCQSA